MKKLFICGISLLFITVGLFSCDSTTAPGDILENNPAVKQLYVSPTNVVFTEENDGYKDTTVTFTIKADIVNVDSSLSPTVVIADKETDLVWSESELKKDAASNEFVSQISLNISTTTFANLIVNVFVDDESESVNYAQTNISIKGFSNNPPVILSADNPPSVSRPTTGTTPVAFTAKVIDSDGQSTIEGVFMRLISQVTGEVGGSPFILYDNGRSGGDRIENDSTFTKTLEINSENRSEAYDIHYYAIDKGGLISDTVKTTFRITY